MSKLYPLKFEPIFKPTLWGGTHLRPFLNRPRTDEPTGEAWVVSDVEGSPSIVTNGPLAGRTLTELMKTQREGLLGAAKCINDRFPLLLKFLDAKQELSVQVHPTDEQAARRSPGSLGKTEAWVVLAANPETSRLYAGFRTGVTAESFRAAMANHSTPETLHQFVPKAGDCVFLEAGTVHAIGRDLLLFEVQQSSDITYRLYDWDRVDAKTGKPRELHIEDGLASSNFDLGPCDPVQPVRRGDRDRLVDCRYFTLDHYRGSQRIRVDEPGRCKIIVVLEADGRSELEWDDVVLALQSGDAYLLPACLGECSLLPAGPIRILEIGLPE